MRIRVKFKPGQVWQRASDLRRYCLVHIKGSWIFCHPAGNPKGLQEFAIVDAKGMGEINTYDWSEIVPRECLCGTNREVCTYHKAEHYQIVDKNL